MLSITSLGIAPGGGSGPTDPTDPTAPPGRPPPLPPRQTYATQSAFTPTMNIDQPIDTTLAPQPTYQPPSTYQPPPPIAVMCPDGSSAADISLCPVPLDIGPIVTVSPPTLPMLCPDGTLVPMVTQPDGTLAPGYCAVPQAPLSSSGWLLIGSAIALISGIALSFSPKRRGLGIGLGLAGLGGGYLAYRQSGGFYAG